VVSNAANAKCSCTRQIMRSICTIIWRAHNRCRPGANWTKNACNKLSAPRSKHFAAELRCPRPGCRGCARHALPANRKRSLQTPNLNAKLLQHQIKTRKNPNTNRTTIGCAPVGGKGLATCSSRAARPWMGKYPGCVHYLSNSNRTVSNIVAPKAVHCFRFLLLALLLNTHLDACE
jgi:hypothetical protein